MRYYSKRRRGKRKGVKQEGRTVGKKLVGKDAGE